MKKISIFAVRFVSNLFRMNGLRACRYYPTCSVYSVQAFEEFGFVKALWVSLKRVLSCHPFSAGGFDPLRTNNKGLSS